MKIKVRKTTNCVVLVFARTDATAEHHFYATLDELDRLTTGFGVASDGGNLLHARYGQLALIESAMDRRDASGKVGFVRLDMDAAKFFGRIKDLLDRDVLSENDYLTLDTDSFGHKAEIRTEMNFSQILRNPAFLGKAKLFEAMGNVGKDQLLKLRDIISRHLQMGKAVADDWAPNSFYFYQPNGKGYNGGIIWHEQGRAYSVHT